MKKSKKAYPTAFDNLVPVAWKLQCPPADAPKSEQRVVTVYGAEYAAELLGKGYTLMQELYGLESRTISEVKGKSDPNWEDYRFVYLLMSGGAFANKEIGWCCGVGAWRHARQFQCYPDVKAARANSSWHNDPDAISRSQIVRLVISVEPKIFPLET